MKIAHNNRNFGLDIVRSVAILSVVIIHVFFASIWKNKDPGVIWYLAYFGVELFFALSGFLIGRILLSIIKTNTGLTSENGRIFLVRRALRTVPLYFIFLIVNLVIYIFHEKELSHLHLWKYFFWLQNFTTAPPDFFGESWSLTIEEWSYVIVIFVLMFTTSSFNRKRIKSYVITIVGIILTISLFRFFVQHPTRYYFTVTLFRLDAIMYGVLLAGIFDIFPKLKNKGLLLALAGGILSISGTMLFLKAPQLGTWSIVYYNVTGIGLATVTATFSVINFKKIDALENVVTLMSKISYSAYLINLPVLTLFENSGFATKLPVIFAITALIITFTLSYFSYSYLEVPVMDYRNRKYPLKTAF